MATDRRQFLRQLGFGALTTGLLLDQDILFANALMPGVLPRCKPEDQAVLSSGITAYIDAVEKHPKIQPHSLMIVRHGQVLTEGWWYPYAAAYKHTLYSLSKSFTSTAVGLAISEGRMKLDSPVVSFFPAESPSTISPNLAAMTVQHLLMMGTGHEKDTLQRLRDSTTDSWVKTFLSLPVERQPGTYFIYNTGATYMQAAIVEKVTGQKLIDYLKPRLFDPLGIEGMDWETNSDGINVGGYGLRIRTEDIARFGLLYLNKGKWNDKELVPSSWVADATTAHIDNSPAVHIIPKEKNDWSQGYGYQFWRCTHNAFRGDGAFGQFCLVLPEKDTVIAITGESFDLQASMDLVWEHLYPALMEGKIPQDNAAHKNLTQKLTSLKLNPPSIQSTSAWSQKINGKTFALDENQFKAKTVSFRFSGNECGFNMTDDKGSHALKCGMGKWTLNDNRQFREFFTSNRPDVPTPIAASVTWSDSNTLMLTMQFVETAHADHLIFKFDESKLTLNFMTSVTKGNPDSKETRPEVVGKMS